LSELLLSMTEEVLHDVISVMSFKEVYDSLQNKFNSSKKVCTIQICVELATSKKDDLPTTDFFCKFTRLSIELTIIDAPLRDEEVIAYLLVGLPARPDNGSTDPTRPRKPRPDQCNWWVCVVVLTRNNPRARYRP
jgi:hypothetical protein